MKRLLRHSPYRGHLGDRAALALHQAVHLNRHSVVQLLLEAGANPNGRNEEGYTPLFTAVRSGIADVSMARLLLDAGADPNARHPSARAMSVRGLNFAPRDTTLLMHTVISGPDPIARLLLERGASVDAVDSEGKTALHWWALMRPADRASRELGRALAKRAKSINAKDQSGKTALDYAELASDAPRVEILREAGASH